MPRRLAPALLAAAALAGGCGGPPAAGPEGSEMAVQGVNIAASDVAIALEAESSILTFCGYVRDERGSQIPLDAAVTTLIGVFQRSPSGTFAPQTAREQRSMRRVLQEDRARLSACGAPRQAARIQRALDREQA
jgi:hypothetical protein